MTPVVGEICYAVIMVDTTLIARKHAMVQWWYGEVGAYVRGEAVTADQRFRTRFRIAI
jgi:hypothetical protein